MRLEKIRKYMSNGTFTIYCTAVEIYQQKENGIKLSGHGTIKINSIGSIYLEFICTSTENILNNQNLNEIRKEILYLKATSLDGTTYHAEHFSMQLPHLIPSCIVLLLPEIYKAELLIEQDQFDSSYLYFEFTEDFDLPANTTNAINSTLGYNSHSRNQSKIKFTDFNVSIVKHDSYYEVSASGTFIPSQLLECLLFYISLSSGSNPQPYIIIKQEPNSSKKTTFKSIDNRKSNHKSSSPMLTYVEDYLDHEFHFDLLRGIYNTYKQNNLFYKSITSQWDRVWHGSYSNEHAILALTLSVAIEGIINDIYLPKLKNKLVDANKMEEIKEVKSKINNLNLNVEYSQALHNAISFEKKITPTKVLNYLNECSIITKEEKIRWITLRNACAHPEIISEQSSYENLENILSCFNLLHSLILNVFSYEGPRHYLTKEQSRKVFITQFINILDND